jgi:hypothetical protein
MAETTTTLVQHLATIRSFLEHLATQAGIAASCLPGNARACSTSRSWTQA